MTVTEISEEITVTSPSSAPTVVSVAGASSAIEVTSQGSLVTNVSASGGTATQLVVQESPSPSASVSTAGQSTVAASGTLPGPPGPGAQTGERAFAVASDTWEWDHGFGYTPNVWLMDASRQSIVGNVTFNDSNRTVVEFFFPVAGIMALS